MNPYISTSFFLFSVIVLPFSYVICFKCPSECSCHEDVVDCIGANLSSIPLDIPEETKYLNLNNNNIRRLENLPFRHLKMLTHLSLHDNKISKIDQDTFTGMSHLTVLYLQRNYLHSLDHGIFSGASNLKDLDLSKNKISDTNGIFKNLWTLKNLYISENYISHLKENSFSDMNNLEVLEISRNLLKKMNLKAFQNLKKLLILKVDQNMIDEITDTLPDSIPLQMLDLSRCEFRIFPEQIPKGIKYLNLGMNKLSSISRNNLENLSSLQMLILDNNRINNIEAKAFGSLTNLHELWLNHNAISNVPKFLPASLKSLVLDYNTIKTIPPQIFPEYSSLQTISLQNNHLNNIVASAFSNLDHLKELYLDGNNITCIQNDAFSYLPKLQILSLSKCLLKVIKKHAFRNLSNLKQLLITYIREPVLRIDNFVKNLPSLEIFNIQSSPSLIENITNSKLFLRTLSQTATNLKEFNIMNGDLTTLPKFVRTYLLNVTAVKLAGNLWFCDKELIFLYKWLIAKPSQFTQKDKITCAMPQDLRDFPVSNLTARHFVEMSMLEEIKTSPFELSNFIKNYKERIIVKDVNDMLANREYVDISVGMTKICPIDNNKQGKKTDATKTNYFTEKEIQSTMSYSHNKATSKKQTNFKEQNNSKINNKHKSASGIESDGNSNDRDVKRTEFIAETTTSNKPSVHNINFDVTTYQDTSNTKISTELFIRSSNDKIKNTDVPLTQTPSISNTSPTNKTPDYLKIWASTASVTTVGITLATSSLFYFVLRFRRRKSQSTNSQQSYL
ncbi:leucine-rich repeat-containing protein 15-like [Argonauta hians]